MNHDITNQYSIRNQENTNINAGNTQEELIKIKKNLKQSRVNKTEKPSFLESSTIQQLLSQQSEVAKKNIMKKSVDNMIEKNQIHNEELEEEINKELKKYFGSDINTSDTSKISDKYEKEVLEEKYKKPTEENHANTYYAAKKKFSKNNLKNDAKLDTLFDAEEDDPTDFVQLKTKQKISDQKQNIQQRNPLLLHQKDVKEYAQLVSKYALNQQPNTKHKLEKLKQHLLQRGLTISEINHMANKVGQVIKQHYVYDLKQQLINFHMSKGFSKQTQVQESISFSKSSNFIEELRTNNKLPTQINDVVHKLRHQAKQDLGNFLYEESTNQFTKYSLGHISIEEFTEQLKKLQKAATSAGVNISERDLENKIFAAIDHLGLQSFTKPDSGSEQQNKEPEKIITPEEALDDKLRYLYMIKALHPSLRHKVDVHFKMKKCRNGMIKLGFYTEEKEDALKKQGEFLAANQFREEIHYLFREEATLEHLSGAEYGVLRKKKAFYLSQLRKVGHGLNQETIDKIQENMYREMYSLIKEEILQLEEIAEIKQHISVTKRLSHLKKVINRIIETVTIDDYNEMQQKLIQPKNQSLINEGA